MSVKNLTNSGFKDLLNEEGSVVLIDFFAEWCPPCKMMAPIIEGFTKDEDLKSVDIYEVDVDQERELAGQFEVMSIPTFVLLKTKGDGEFEELQKWIGGKDPLSFKSDIQKHL